MNTIRRLVLEIMSDIINAKSKIEALIEIACSTKVSISIECLDRARRKLEEAYDYIRYWFNLFEEVGENERVDKIIQRIC